MVFPSLGCLTCKKRRVKCDSTRPICNRCHTASRSCSWESNEDTSLPFKSENAFAQGKPRRPRGQLVNRPQRVALVHANQLSSSLSIPIETLAFNYFEKNFTVWPNDMPDIGRDYMTYSLCHWSRAGPGSSLQLAVSAFSHAVFWRRMGAPKALETADRFYARCIVQTQKEMRELSNEKIDHLVVATLLMTNYENFMYGAKRTCIQNPRSSISDEVGSRFWKNICHYIGAVGLLKVRQQEGYRENLPLYRAVRRPIIRACILRGDTVQQWLRDGAQYGEEGPALKLDVLLIRVAALRSKSLNLFRQKNLGRLLQADRTDVVAEAQNLDVALASWPQDLPEDWRFSTHCIEEYSDTRNPAHLYSDSVHSYTTHGHAAVWMRFMAVRLIVSSILIKLLSALLPKTSINEQIGTLHQNLNLLATDMCCSVPFFFTSIATNHNLQSESFKTSDKTASLEILPKIATILSWPLSVAVSTTAVPTKQKEWLKTKLKLVASVQGDAVVQSIAETEEFKF
ncbi:hypothetical protein N431DRAFT_333214 [Stipitochalara longipes BDJ]|nr:hypothetical protein N431DRAFT_333214 [Stipitochalara longipes BDJ]